MSDVLYFSGSSRAIAAIQHPDATSTTLTHFTQSTQADRTPQKDRLRYIHKVWVHENLVPDTDKELRALTDKQLDAEFQSYIEHTGGSLPKGGFTLEESYLGLQIASHTRCICLINDAQVPQPSARISRKAFLESHILVDFIVSALKSRLCKYYFGLGLGGSRSLVRLPTPLSAQYPTYISSGYVALEYDGETAHCITLTGLDSKTGDVVYYDPWPGPSLLSVSENVAGVSAVPYICRYGERLWCISQSDLAKVIYAVMLPQQQWQDLMLGQ